MDGSFDFNEESEDFVVETDIGLVEDNVHWPRSIHVNEYMV